MVRTWIAVLAIVMTGAWDAVALTGSATSGTNPLETVSPTLDSITAVTEGSLTATFSEPLLALGAAAPENYAVSGSGAGTLNLNPSTVTGTGPYALTWSTGEMQNAQSVVLTATGIQDLAGNPINPLQNSASCAGMGTAPTFSNLQVVPAEGSVDHDVTLTFTASEPLNAPPTVTVNGHPANYVSGSPSGDYVYTYTVQASDPIGAASVAISGTDAAGNPATFDDASTLSISAVITKLPLNSRPLALVLLVVGLLTVALRPRRAIAPLFLLALLLACTPAFAAGPTVSNVTFAQSPDGGTGTKVDIYYDLLAPTGSCAIELSLSKDGGADGFSHPMDHYTGDIAGVTTGTSKHIVWDIRADYPEENIPLARIRILADDGVVQHTLTYAAGSNGSLSGTSPQTVIHGASGTAVSAVPDTNYHFVQWSDGITDNPRTDTNVTTDKLLTALFAINTHSLTYSVETNGTITGTSPQTVDHGSDGTQVTAVPNTGYHFTQWSDGNLSATRTDTNITADLSVTASFAIDTHTLTYAANTNGSITGTSPQTVNYGASGTAVSAVPDTGYHFVQWSDSSTQNPRTDTNVTNDLSVTASFAINTYTITYSAGANGTISGISPQNINHGADATQVNAIPDTGYHFVQWSDSSTQNPRTDTNITAALSLTAGFSINTYSLTYAAGTHGAISGTSPQTVSYGSSGTQVTAVPSIGYHFVQWSDGVLTAARTDATVVADLSVSATFAINTYTLTYTPGTNGTITGTSPQTVNYGASGSQVTAVPNTGYHFVQWSDGVLTAARTDATVVADLSVAATFAINTYTLTYTAGANGTITGTSPQTVNYGASGSQVTAVPNTGYHFVQWSDGVLTAARTDATVVADLSVSATFAINTYTLTYTPGTNGTITGTSPQTVNYGASGSQVTAVPNTGYHFVQWSDGVLTAARTDATVVADLSVAATFAINTYTLTYTAGANGTITGTSPQTVNYGASGTTVTAVPNAGYGFSQWSDGVLTAARTETNMTADTSVSAIFGPLPVVSSFALNSGAATTISELAVTLNNTATNTPTLYMASESALFTDATWQTYATSPEFSLSTGVGTRTVYFKVKNGFGESAVVSDTIILTPITMPVASGTFTMGRTSSGDDATNGFTNEDAQHSVLLGAYQIAKYDVTNKEFCDVLNWAKAQGYLYTNTAGTPWTGTGNIYAGASLTTRYLIVSFTSADCNIQYSGGLFTSKTRTSTPSGTTYSMDTHPMVRVSWYGSVAFCNWMSLMQGLTPCYDMTTANWPLTIAPPTAGGYRLPTEAEWECAAAWDGSKHWTYGFMSDTNSGAGSNNRCNDYWFDGSVSAYLNPFSLSANPFTSPVGWFNGVNVSPSGNVTTVNSPSPVGAYDMSGQVWQWCQDSWDKTSGYGAAAAVNPIGVSGTNKVYRGGSWFNAYYNCRTARRDGNLPTYTNNNLGFRISMSN